MRSRITLNETRNIVSKSCPIYYTVRNDIIAKNNIDI